MHRGQRLKKVVDDNGINISTLSKKVGYSRASYYNHINNKDLSLDIIAKYGKALGYDFSKNIPAIKELTTFSDKAPATLQEAISTINYWKDKYYNILEKHNSLMEEKLDKK